MNTKTKITDLTSLADIRLDLLKNYGRGWAALCDCHGVVEIMPSHQAAEGYVGNDGVRRQWMMLLDADAELESIRTAAEESCRNMSQDGDLDDDEESYLLRYEEAVGLIEESWMEWYPDIAEETAALDSKFAEQHWLDGVDLWHLIYIANLLQKTTSSMPRATALADALKFLNRWGLDQTHELADLPPEVYAQAYQHVFCAADWTHYSFKRDVIDGPFVDNKISGTLEDGRSYELHYYLIMPMPEELGNAYCDALRATSSYHQLEERDEEAFVAIRDTIFAWAAGRRYIPRFCEVDIAPAVEIR